MPVVIGGALVDLDWSLGLSASISELFASLRGTTAGTVVLSLLVSGATCIVVSTADSLMLILTMFVHDEVLREDSKNTEDNPRAVRNARLLMACLFLLAFIARAGMYYTRPNIFFLLLAIGTGAAVFTPLIVLIGVLSSNEPSLKVISPIVLGVFTALFVLAIATGLLASVWKPGIVPFVSLTFLGMSSVFAIGVRFQAVQEVN